MNPEAQRIAIAEVMGYPNPRMGLFNRCYAGDLPNLEDVPDYLNDLNAMHEAIVSLPKDKRFQVAQMTTEIVLRRDDWACCEEDVWGLLASAEAHEWAEAFLRTLGLWKEDA